MQVTDKLTKALTEAKYLNADNVSRYRCIMRIFFENYEKLRYWLYQEEVYDQMIARSVFCGLQAGAVPTGSGNASRVEESEYDSGYEKGFVN